MDEQLLRFLTEVEDQEGFIRLFNSLLERVDLGRAGGPAAILGFQATLQLSVLVNQFGITRDSFEAGERLTADDFPAEFDFEETRRDILAVGVSTEEIFTELLSQIDPTTIPEVGDVLSIISDGFNRDLELLISNWMAENLYISSEEALQDDALVQASLDLFDLTVAKARVEIGPLTGDDLALFAEEQGLSIIDAGILTQNNVNRASALLEAFNRTERLDSPLRRTVDTIDTTGWRTAANAPATGDPDDVSDVLWNSLISDPTDFIIDDQSLSGEAVRVYLERNEETIRDEFNNRSDKTVRWSTWVAKNLMSDIRYQVNNGDEGVGIGLAGDYVLDSLVQRFAADFPIANEYRSNLKDHLKIAIQEVRSQFQPPITKQQAYTMIRDGRADITFEALRNNFLENILSDQKGGLEFIEAARIAGIQVIDLVDPQLITLNPRNWIQNILDTGTRDFGLPAAGANTDEEMGVASYVNSLLTGDPYFDQGGLILQSRMRGTVMSLFAANDLNVVTDATKQEMREVLGSLGQRFGENELRGLILGAFPVGSEEAQQLMEALDANSLANNVDLLTSYQEIVEANPKWANLDLLNTALLSAEGNLGPTDDELAQFGISDLLAPYSAQDQATAQAQIDIIVKNMARGKSLSEALADPELGPIIQQRIDFVIDALEADWAGGDELLLAIVESFGGVSAFIEANPELVDFDGQAISQLIQDDPLRFTSQVEDATPIEEVLVDIGVAESLEELREARSVFNERKAEIDRRVEAQFRERLQGLDARFFAGALEDIAAVVEKAGGELDVTLSNAEILAEIEETIQRVERETTAFLEGEEIEITTQALAFEAQRRQNEAAARRQQFQDSAAGRQLVELQEREQRRSETGAVFQAELERQVFGTVAGPDAQNVIRDIGPRLTRQFQTISEAHFNFERGRPLGANVAIEGVFAPPSPEEFLANLGPDFFSQQRRESQLRRRRVQVPVARDITGGQRQGPQFTVSRI